MQSPNRILERVKKGEKALGMAMPEPSEILVETAARMGFDFISLDGQHTVLPPDKVETICRIADGFGISVSVRVPDQEESTLFMYLDRGVRTITIPNLQTAAEAERLVRLCFFGPLGRRSATSKRTTYSSGGDERDMRKVYDFTNANTLLSPQLESITAFNNLDEILQVDGIDYFTGGPQDIAQSMGFHGQPDHPEPVAAFQAACEKVRAAGKHMMGDVTESIDVLSVVFGAGKELLAKHGRTCGIHPR